MGGSTTVTKITVDGAGGAELLSILGGVQPSTGRRLAGPVGPVDVAVDEAMLAAARGVFLSPDRVEALRDTLAEVYRAMERARRTGR